MADIPPNPATPASGGVARRTAFKAVGATLGAAAFAKALAPLTEWAPNLSVDEFLQKHYKELSREELAKIIERLEAETRQRYGAEVRISDTPAQDDVQFAYALNLSICVGCRKCAEACHRENNHDRPSQQSYIRVLEMQKGSLDLEKGEAHYQHPVPRKDKFYMPVQCHQCDRPPCVSVCPVEATWKEKDGIVVVDYNWCIGCRMCMGACPYWARRINLTNPVLPKEEMNPVTHYLGNRPRMRGVVEKCHWCLQRTRHDRYPACVEVCPVGARKFGNLLDPESEVSKILERKNVFRLKAELNTFPKFFYFYD